MIEMAFVLGFLAGVVAICIVLGIGLWWISRND